MFRKKPDDRPRVIEVMRLRGAYLPDPLAAGAARHLEEAKRRCQSCNWKKLCDEALAAEAKGDFGRFCPNIHYIEQVRCASLNFG